MGSDPGERPKAPPETTPSSQALAKQSPPVAGGGPAAIPTPPQAAALTCWTELFSGTANSSFSFGVFTVTFMILGSVEAVAAGAPAPSAAAALSWELGGPPLSPFSAMAAAVTQAQRRERVSEREPGNARARLGRAAENVRHAASVTTGSGPPWRARSRGAWRGLRRRPRSAARQPPCVQTPISRSDIRSSRRRRRFLLPAPPPTPLCPRRAGHAG